MTTSVLGTLVAPDRVVIDISKAKFDVALLQAEQYQLATFDNDSQGFGRLARWLRKRRVTQLHACMEATGAYGDELALYLHAAGHRVSVVNPARIKAYAQSQLARNTLVAPARVVKTDRYDAKVIAHFAATQNMRPWTPPVPEMRSFRALMRCLRALKDMRTQEQNRLQAAGLTSEVCASVATHLSFLQDQIAELQATIDQLVARHPELKSQCDLLQSIPGIGKHTAYVLLTEIGDWRTFPSARQLAVFAGLTPRQRTSGSSVRGRTKLAKTGNAHLRKALYWPAIVAQKHNPIIHVFCERLLARGLCKMSVIAAAMRKLLHIAFGVLKSGRPFDPAYVSAAQVAP